MQPSRKAKNPKSQNFYSLVDPMILISSIGSTGDNEKPSPSRIGVSQPATFGKLDDWRIKPSPKELKFWGDEDDDFEDTSPKDFNEIPHE